MKPARRWNQRRVALLRHHHPPRFALEIGVVRLLDGDADALDRPSLEGAWCLVFLADGVAAVEADAEPVAAERELAGLRLHRPFRHHLIVDIQLRGPDRFALFTGLL